MPRAGRRVIRVLALHECFAELLEGSPAERADRKTQIICSALEWVAARIFSDSGAADELRALYDAYAGRDVDGAVRYLDPDVELRGEITPATACARRAD
jgi:hypothetical protein